MPRCWNVSASFHFVHFDSQHLSHGTINTTLCNSKASMSEVFCAAAGFARLPNQETIRNPHIKAAMAKFEEYEAVARKQHKGIFVYGDPGNI